MSSVLKLKSTFWSSFLIYTHSFLNPRANRQQMRVLPRLFASSIGDDSYEKPDRMFKSFLATELGIVNGSYIYTFKIENIIIFFHMTN